MNKESLIKAKDIILYKILESKINGEDKANLVETLSILLNEENYEKNVKALRKIRYKRK